MEEQAEDLRELLSGGLAEPADVSEKSVVSTGNHKTRIIAITSGKGGCRISQQ